MADFVIVRKGGPSFEGGSPTPPGNISSFGTVSYAHKDGKTEIRFNPAEPSPLGTYKGIAIYVEDPDQSGVDLLVADGSTAWDGTAVAAGEAKPILAGRHEYKALEPDAPAIAKIPYRNATRTVRIKALSFSTQVTNAYASSPSTTLEITPDGPAKPDSATAWTEMATGISAPTMYTGDEDGKLKRYLIFDGIAVPSDTRFAGWSIWSHGWPNDAEFYRMCPDQTGTSVIVEMDEPTSSLTLTFYLRSSGFDAEGKPHLNPIVAGITPSVAVAVGTTSGVLDISKAFGFNAAEFEVTIDGYSVKAVDFTKGLNSIVLDGSEVPQVTIAPDGVALGWIGKDAASGYAGAWFKRVLVGGTAPANAPFFADASGNVVANGIYVNSAGTPLGWIGANGGLTGAWFKKLYVGGSAPASAKIVADASGNVTINEADLTFTDGSGIVYSLGPSYGLTTKLGSGSPFTGSYGNFQASQLKLAQLASGVEKAKVYMDAGSRGASLTVDDENAARKISISISATYGNTVDLPLLSIAGNGVFDSSANLTAGGAWNGRHIQMTSGLATYHLWVDGSGRLRIKSGAPASDTDGTIVGTQS